MLHAESREIQKLVDSDVLLLCSCIEQSLRNRDTTKCLEWCQENKVQLKKIRVSKWGSLAEELMSNGMERTVSVGFYAD
jgi:hypothetical protein